MALAAVPPRRSSRLQAAVTDTTCMLLAAKHPLPALLRRRRHITGPGYVPPELSTLTGLQSLLVAYDRHSEPPLRYPDGNLEWLRAACLQLTGLTSL